MDETGEIPFPADKKAPNRPSWQKEFTQSDYDHFLAIAQQRVNKEALDTTLGNVQDRLTAADYVGVLPEEGAPTFVAREEFIDVPHASLLIARVNALSYMTERFGRKAKGSSEHVLKYRIAEFETNTAREIVPTQVVFSASTELPEATIGVRMTQDNRFSVNVDFAKEPFEEVTPPSYHSGLLPVERLTSEEIHVLARAALEVGFYNMFGDPSKSPYPWENPPSPTQFP